MHRSLHWKFGLKIIPGAHRCTICANKTKKVFQIVSIVYVIVHLNIQQISYNHVSIHLLLIQIVLPSFCHNFICLITKFLCSYYKKCEAWTLIWTWNMGMHGSIKWNLKQCFWSDSSGKRELQRRHRLCNKHFLFLVSPCAWNLIQLKGMTLCRLWVYVKYFLSFCT